MLKIVLIMLCGVGVGYLLHGKKLSGMSHVITVLIWILLLLLGMEVGTNPRIVNGLQKLGLEALLLALGGSLGSMFLAWALWKFVEKGGKE